MSLAGALETVYRVSEKSINRILQEKPTVQGICDLILQVGNEKGGH